MNIRMRPPVPGGPMAGGDGGPDSKAERGTFTAGSTMRHVLVMTAAGSVGLIAVFFVDFLSLLYISRLGDPSLTAAVGYASQIMFLLISLSIGLSIAIGALVSRALGAGDRPRARRLAASGLVHVTVILAVLSLAAMPFTHAILEVLGARDRALEVGATYLRMVLPASMFLGIGMGFSSILRAVGDAKRAMYVTLAGAIVTACLDPVLIFGLHLGIYGAAAVLVTSRFVLLSVGWHGAVRVHDLVARPRLSVALADLAPLMTIAVPAILTNLANPAANIYTMRIFSRFGQETVAAFAIMDRVTPVAFGVLFALSGSVGPIMGQNYGARLLDRVRMVLTDCLIVAVAFVVFVAVVLWAAAPLIVSLFGAKGETATLLIFFCSYAGFLWFFLAGFSWQRRLQQSWRALYVGNLQLGPGNARHGAVRDDRCGAVWARGRLRRHDRWSRPLWRHRGWRGLPCCCAAQPQPMPARRLMSLCLKAL